MFFTLPQGTHHGHLPQARGVRVKLINQMGLGEILNWRKEREAMCKPTGKNANLHQDLNPGPLFIMTNTLTTELQGPAKRPVGNWQINHPTHIWQRMLQTNNSWCFICLFLHVVIRFSSIFVIFLLLFNLICLIFWLFIIIIIFYLIFYFVEITVHLLHRENGFYFV